MEESALVASRIARITAHRTLDDPRIGDAILTSLLRIFGAAEGQIYTLDLSSGRYKSPAREFAPEGEAPRASIDARQLRLLGGRGPLERTIQTRKPQIERDSSSEDSTTGRGRYHSRMVIPILRQSTVVGFVDLKGLDASAYQTWSRRRLNEVAPAISQQLANAYDVRSVHRILERTAKFKVDLYEEETTTLRNLMEFVGESSGMQYAVLRRLESNDSLRCVRTYGFPSFADESLSFSNFSKEYIPFAQVVKTRSHWTAPNLKGENYRALREQPELSNVRSFVACPVLIGNTIWGVLSFAAAVEYEYSNLEIYSLRALANLAGVALDAAQAADKAAEVQFDDGRLMQAVLANEVVVATRHEMSDQLEIVGGTRSSLFDIVTPLTNPDRGTRLTRKDVEYLMSQAKNLDSAHGEMNKIMDTISVSQRELLPEENQVVIQEVWRRAKESFNFRINSAGVTRIACDVPDDLAIIGSDDWLRIVFMHLLLNSLDAFDRPFAKGRRDIVLRLEERRAGDIRLRYHDTAGGIIPRSLVRRGSPLAEVADVRNVIFERFVSSKEKGTGLGLASCRAALQTMAGSIELIDWRKGITFDITLHEWTND